MPPTLSIDQIADLHGLEPRELQRLFDLPDQPAQDTLQAIWMVCEMAGNVDDAAGWYHTEELSVFGMSAHDLVEAGHSAALVRHLRDIRSGTFA